MITPSALKKSIQKQSAISMSELCKIHGSNALDTYVMLKPFIECGKILTTNLTPKCGSKCQQCDPLYTLKFTWKQ